MRGTNRLDAMRLLDLMRVVESYMAALETANSEEAGRLHAAADIARRARRCVEDCVRANPRVGED